MIIIYYPSSWKIQDIINWEQERNLRHLNGFRPIQHYRYGIRLTEWHEIIWGHKYWDL